MTLSLITNPTNLQAQTEADGSLTVAVRSDGGYGVGFADYSQADRDGHITIMTTEPLSTGMVIVNYFVN